MMMMIMMMTAKKNICNGTLHRPTAIGYEYINKTIHSAFSSRERVNECQALPVGP
jgi:hypothetical protein